MGGENGNCEAGQPTDLPAIAERQCGYGDRAGFLALQGPFTAYVTGNFITLGASLALVTSGVVAKLWVLSIFCVVVIATRLLGTLLSNHIAPVFEILMVIKLPLLIGALCCGTVWAVS